MDKVLNFGMQFRQMEPASLQYKQAEKPIQCPQLRDTFKGTQQSNTQQFTKLFSELVSQNQVTLQKVMQNTARQVKMSGQQSLSAKEREIA